MATKGLYRMHFDCGRMGAISGCFFSDDEKVASLAGKNIYFGEVLGKHSEVNGTLDNTDIVLVTDNPDIVNPLRACISSDTLSGYNPFDYVE